MARKHRFPPEADTNPTNRRPGAPTIKMPRASGPAPKNESADAPTVPPPASRRGARPGQDPSKPEGARPSGVKRRPVRSDHPGATVDEVVADLSRDPRREDE